MYDPREDLYGVGPDDYQLDVAGHVFLASRSASPPLTPIVSETFNEDDDLSFPVYESHGIGDEHGSSESTEPSLTPSMVLRPMSQVLIERPEDDTAARMLPIRHVDYLSHEWSEEDLWSTWKHIVSGRSAYDNSVRLENASWRCWEKTRRNLQTVSPGSVKWMKDHDVTWLYGPLQPGNGLGGPCRSVENLRSRRSNSIRQLQKPILKKRSLSELMLRKSVSSASLLRQAATAAEVRSGRNEVFSAYSSFLFTNPALTPPSSYTSEIGTPNPNSWKNVRFYELVEQCVAVGNLDDEESPCHDPDDEGIVMRKMPRQIPKQLSPVAPIPKTSPSKTIEKLPHAPLKSPEPPNYDGLGLSYLQSQPTVTTPVEPATIVFEDEGEADEDDDWKPPTWFCNRKDSVHLLHDKLDAIKKSIGASQISKPLHGSPQAITALEKGNTVPVTALTAEGRKSPMTFKLAAFSFTSKDDMNTPALSSCSSDDTSVPKSCRSRGVDPAFTSIDYFSPRISDNNHFDDDEYDWIEASAPEDIMNIKSLSFNNLPSPTSSPHGINTILSLDSIVSEDDPIARTSSDSGYGPELPTTLHHALNGHASVRDTYKGTAEIEKGRAVCDWDLYPGAWDAVELEEAVAWSKGF
ncbi:hypothetical protein OIDMADRAFT_142550 [Oidiodendron maius Zn]|uniref:Nitrogen regulatory protein areA GATA-like domain-containing protein n=1 Tax=Oidiodendron maius (strain Zn) TaxID=913774 RepID=A0A0C3D0F1_OIDMZ|nr:hypothetical protein OIDMADRAFT_142550 [Oidiodendron maius Zn]